MPSLRSGSRGTELPVFDHSTNGLSVDNLAQIARSIHIEDHDRQIVLLTHREGGQIHHLQFAIVHLVEGDLAKLGGSGIFFGIGRVDTIYPCPLQQHFCFDLYAAQRYRW